ncbi:hypothetical protein H8959_009952 [Pygathrix nigripes]
MPKAESGFSSTTYVGNVSELQFLRQYNGTNDKTSHKIVLSIWHKSHSVYLAVKIKRDDVNAWLCRNSKNDSYSSTD